MILNTATKHTTLHYKASNLGRFKSTIHYELTNVSTGDINDTDLTEKLNLSDDRDCAKSSPTYWLQVRQESKWRKPRLTGLFATEYRDIFKGDTRTSKNKVIFKFSKNKEELTIYFFQNLHFPRFYQTDLRCFKVYLESKNQ
tara:strand:+ start:1412 stop:1837 length:426 start_codon:yes stop_codon:yes gene_type:complete